MRLTATALLALLALAVGPVFADTETTKTADVDLTIEMFVALTDLQDQLIEVPQEGAPETEVSIGGDQHVWLHKNCDVNLILDVTDLIPNEATAEKGAEPLPVESVGMADIRGGQSLWIMDTHAEMVFEWVWCTENGEGEDAHISYHWLRNGLCDHAGTYVATVTLTAIGIDP